jgi:hypothetical protein
MKNLLHNLTLFTALVLLTTITALTQAGQQPSADPPSQATWAVTRLASHGASATVIATEPGKTLLLSCGHAFVAEQRSKRITLDLPTNRPTEARAVGIQLLQVDHEADLSLLLLRAGPVDFVCPVAPPRHRAGRLLSVGYDNMRLPATVLPAHIVQLSPQVTYTRERPWHGRSGGALLDADAGCLLGVVSGYETQGLRRGIYASHQAILRFLERYRQGSAPPSSSRDVPLAPLPAFPAPWCRPGGG